MKTILKTLIILCVFSLCYSYTANAKKTLLLENFVCNGFSLTPPTIWHTDSIQKLYPEDVILVRHHYDKDAVYDTWNQYLVDSLGTHYMTLFSMIANDYSMSYIAFLNRKKYEVNTGDISYPIPRDLYPYVKEELKEKEKLSISVDWSVDKNNLKLFAKVHAIMLETVERPLRFNLYVVEDSIMGQGLGWDQVNGLSGNGGWLPCPYVYEPNPIPNFMHRHVVRKCLGGTFGVHGSFDNPAPEGKYYTHDFHCDIDPRWDMDKLSVVGLVQVYDRDNDDYEVLNAARGVCNNMPFSVNSSSEEFVVLEKDQSFNKIFTLKNISNAAKEYEYHVSKSDRTPSCWTLSDEGSKTVLLQPNESKEIIVDLYRDGACGIGDALLTVKEANNPASLVWKEKMTIYSKEITHFHVTDEYGFMEYSLSPLLNEIGRNNIYEVASGFLMSHASEFPDLKTIIWNTGGYLEAMDSVKIAFLVKWNKEGKNIFLGGNAGAIDHLYYYFPEYFGIKLLAYYGNNDSYPFTGFSDNPISGFLSDSNMIDLPRNISFIGISNSDIASKVLRFNVNDVAHYLTEDLNDDWSTYDSTIASEDAVFAAKTETENARSFIMTKSFYLISDRDTANILLDNIINWLDGISNVEEYEFNSDEFYLGVYPNPASSKINIKFAYDDILSEYIEIGIYDITGRKIRSVYNGLMNPGEKQIEIDISDLIAGCYIITLKNKDEILNCPIIVFR